MPNSKARKNLRVEISLESVLAQAERLSPQERLVASLHEAVASAPGDWHQALRGSYGILKDDPIKRPAQLPLEERDSID